jgi:hypothetical protein
MLWRPSNNVPSTTRTDEEEQDWPDDDFISHRRTETSPDREDKQPEQVALDVEPLTPERSSRPAVSEPERSPEWSSNALPEVINCRRPYQECLNERHGRVQDVEKLLDERIEIWEKQHEVRKREQWMQQRHQEIQNAELRNEMARLKESSIEEITKLRTEVERLRQLEKTPSARLEKSGSARRAEKSSPRLKSMKSPPKTSPVRHEHDAADAGVRRSSSRGKPVEGVKVAHLLTQLQLKEESAAAAQNQILQLQREVEELRLLKKSAQAKDLRAANAG